ncbi:MAG: amidohydrolase family protein [Candidatus Liptonbacteria bacterium]|nr:amidohydrolase family protein [Candidatus Liptonbacteria bacterium]
MLIKGVRIIDGTGAEARKADVLISGDKISAIGDLSGRKDTETIDGIGLTAAPGFISTDTDIDHTLALLERPDQEDLLAQGITTVIGGQAGVSLAPILRGDLHLLGKWTDPYCVNVGWNTIEEFLALLARRRLGVNFGTLTGFSTVREDIVRGTSRDASDPERRAIERMITESLRDGSFGVSFDLDSPPERRVPYDELRAVASAIARERGIAVVRPREGTADSFREIVRLAEESSAIVCAAQPVLMDDAVYARGVDQFGTANRDLFFSASPFQRRRVPVAAFLPPAAEEHSFAAAVQRIPEWADEIERSLMRHSENAVANAVITHAARLPGAVGKTLEAFARMRGCTLVQGVMKLMSLSGLHAVVSMEQSAAATASLFGRARAIVALNGLASPLAVAASLAEARGAPSLEEAIARMTSLPADAFGIAGRGRIAEGHAADLVLFSDTNVRHVILNGTSAVRDGAVTGARTGRVLKKTRSAS